MKNDDSFPERKRQEMKGALHTPSVPFSSYSDQSFGRFSVARNVREFYSDSIYRNLRRLSCFFSCFIFSFEFNPWESIVDSYPYAVQNLTLLCEERVCAG